LEEGQRQTETKNVELNSAFAKLKIAKEEETEELAEKIRQKDAQVPTFNDCFVVRSFQNLWVC
jgi:hypothetical protein